MLLLIRLTEVHRRLMLPHCCLASYSYFHFAYQFITGTLAYTDDSLVRVSRRVTRVIQSDDLIGIDCRTTPIRYASRNTLRRVYLGRTQRKEPPHRTEAQPSSPESNIRPSHSRAITLPPKLELPSRDAFDEFLTHLTIAMWKVHWNIAISIEFHTAFRNSCVCTSTVSRTYSLSLQSSFQLSLTVLVCYRSHICI